MIYVGINERSVEIERDYLVKRAKIVKLSDLLENSHYVKSSIKEYLKSNKYIKFKSNGDDFIEFAPNSKFFKKYKDVEEYNDAIVELMEDYLSTLELGLEDSAKYISISHKITHEKHTIIVTV